MASDDLGFDLAEAFDVFKGLLSGTVDQSAILTPEEVEKLKAAALAAVRPRRETLPELMLTDASTFLSYFRELVADAQKLSKEKKDQRLRRAHNLSGLSETLTNLMRRGVDETCAPVLRNIAADLAQVRAAVAKDDDRRLVAAFAASREARQWYDRLAKSEGTDKKPAGSEQRASSDDAAQAAREGIISLAAERRRRNAEDGDLEAGAL